MTPRKFFALTPKIAALHVVPAGLELQPSLHLFCFIGGHSQDRFRHRQPSLHRVPISIGQAGRDHPQIRFFRLIAIRSSGGGFQRLHLLESSLNLSLRLEQLATFRITGLIQSVGGIRRLSPLRKKRFVLGLARFC